MMISKISRYSLVYKIIDDYSYLTSYASVSMAGGMTFGVYGAVIGIGVSALDDFLVYNNYIKDKSITQAFIGSTLGYNVYPSSSSGLIGGIVSIIVAQDILKDYSNCLSNILVNTIFGMKVSGLSGASAGVVLGVIDQIFLQNNITNKLYLSHGLLGMISFSVVFGKSTIISSSGVILGFIIARNYNTTDFILQPIEISKDLYNIYSKIIPQVQLNSYVKEYSVVLLSSQIVVNQLRMILLKHQQNYVYQFEHMNNFDGNNIHKLNTVTIKFALFVLPYAITELASNILNNFFTTKLYIEVDDVLRSILFENDTALKLSKNRDNMLLIDNLRLDSKVISHDGSKLIVDSVAKSIKGIHGVGVLIINVPETLVYAMLYNKATECIFTILVEWQNRYEVSIKKQESVISSLFKHDMNNIKIITEAGGVLYSYNQLQVEHDKLRESEFIRDQISYVIDTWRSFESIANFFSIYYLVGYQVGAGVIGFDNRINMHYSCLTVSKLLAWTGDKSREIKIIYQSMERISSFLNATFSDEDRNIENIDNIKREQINDEKLVISNLSITITNKKLIHIDHLELRFNNSYVITGPSGSGKSSLITKVVGTINNNIGGEGNIYYPMNAKITLVSQQIYFPLHKSLQEIIFYLTNLFIHLPQVLLFTLINLDYYLHLF